ncbi:DUF4189 domain-containing protein [Porphyrobacter sp. ULC335]|uniref:DUF4189 domain-containing protein n=1 Tax=Porphyrobacter sp. ULC335 TaxID=2854260 RepID=UPI00221F2FB8|nr:DUF4189 domain-containing protein [Porphyrobacter sp. ULC335]UYV15181.1 DUF4189 domain-containing protein [Porphyrobacter sp. ULC335]
MNLVFDTAAHRLRRASLRPGMVLLWIAFAAVFAAVPILPDTTALAQYESFPCPSGPGPGQVGIGPGPGGVPMCRTTTNGNPGSGPAPAVLPSRFNAVAWHQDYEDYWAVGGRPSRSAAAVDAVALCNQDTGGGCTLAAWTENGAVALARRADGNVYIGQAESDASAKRIVLNDCNANSVLPCEIIGTHGSKSGARRPRDLVQARRIYGAAAWIDGDGYDRRLFVATGHPSVAAAEQAAIDACERSKPQVSCTVAMHTGNGFIQVFHAQAANGDMIDRLVPERSAKRAAQAAQQICRKEKSKCLLRGSYDVRTPGLFVHDYGSAATGEPRK